eukprot:CFRG5683T1
MSATIRGALPELGEVALHARKLPRMIKNSNPWVYIFEQHVADRVYEHIKHDLDQATVVEAHPGPGALTRLLMNSNARAIRCLEPCPQFFQDIKRLKSFTEPGRLDVAKVKIEALSSNARLLSFIKFLNTDMLEGESKSRVFTGNAIGGHKTLSVFAIAQQMLTRSIWFPLGMPTRCVLMVNDFDYKRLTSQPSSKQWTRAVMLSKLAADVTTLETFRHDDLHPVLGREPYHLIELIPKPTIPNVQDRDNLVSFAKIIWSRPSQTLHQALRMCGSGAEDLVHKLPSQWAALQVREIGADMFMTIYQEFLAWPERPQFHTTQREDATRY